MQPLPTDATTLSSDQRSLISRQELLELKCSPTTIQRWLRSGVLLRVLPGHYRVGGASRDLLQRLKVAIDRSGPGARVAGSWACALYGLEGFDFGGSRHIAIPLERRVRGVGWTVLRTSIEPIDEDTVLGFPSVTAERALIDAARTEPAKKIRVAFDDGRRRGIVRHDVLAERADALGRVPGAARMRALVASSELRMESEGERRLDHIWRPSDPRPQRQVWVIAAGRYYRLDFAYLDARLDLEYDGGDFHRIGSDRYRDSQRDMALIRVEIQPLRVTKKMLLAPKELRRDILKIREQRLTLGLPPIVPVAPPSWAK